MEHTPAPWHVSQLDDETTFRIDPSHIVSPYSIACDITEETDAAFIVKACNNHNSLVDALEGMVDTFKQFRDHSNRCGDALNDAEEILNKLK